MSEATNSSPGANDPRPSSSEWLLSAGSACANELSQEALLELEPIFQRFEQAWHQGRYPEIDEYLPEETSRRRAALIELIHTDLEFRLKARLEARVEDYLLRYRELQGDRPT